MSYLLKGIPSLRSALPLAVLLAAGCTHGDTLPPQEPNMHPETTTTLAEVHLELQDGQNVRLRVEEWVYFPQQNAIQVGYRLHNGSRDRSIAVFDRGTYEQHAGAVYAPGSVSAPIVKVAGTDIEMIHAALPPATGTGSMPSTSLAIEVKGEEELKGFFVVPRLGNVSLQRLRWCVGVMSFDKSLFRTPYESEFGTIWVAKIDLQPQQKMLCTPWYDVALAKFEPAA